MKKIRTITQSLLTTSEKGIELYPRVYFKAYYNNDTFHLSENFKCYFYMDYHKNPLEILCQINVITSLRPGKAEKLGDSPKLALLAMAEFKLDPSFSNTSSIVFS